MKTVGRRGKSKKGIRHFLGRGGVELWLYLFKVYLLSGPFSARYAKKNKVVSRTILIRNDQTLLDLQYGILDAFRLFELEKCEFHLCKGPANPEAYRYVLPEDFATNRGEENPPAGQVDQARIDSLGLEVGHRFTGWSCYDYSRHDDRWWFQIILEAIEKGIPRGELPRWRNRVGKNPPQFYEDDFDDEYRGLSP